MKRLAYAVTRHRLAVAIGLVCVSLVMAVGVTRLGFDDSYEDVFRSPDPRYQRFVKLAASFGTGENDCVVLLESADMLSREALAAILQIHNEAQELSGVESVVSLYTPRRDRRVGRAFLPLFPPPEAADESLERARREADSHPLVRGVLLSPDHRASLALVRLRPSIKSVDEVEDVLGLLAEVVARGTEGRGVTGSLTGVPAIRVDTIRRIQREHAVVSFAGAALATLVAWVILRRFVAVVLVVAPALVGVLWTLGALGLAGRNLTAINIVLPALVLVIGVTDSIHLMFHFREDRARGLSRLGAAFRCVRDLAGACGLTALTTSVGFLTLLVSPDQIIREFGLFGAIGVCLTFGVVISLLPLLLSTPLGNYVLPRRVSAAQLAWAWPDRVFDWLAPRAWQVVAASVLLAIIFAGAARRIAPEYSFMENLTESSAAYRAMRRTERQFGGGPLLQVLVQWPESANWQSAEMVGVLQEVHSAISAAAVARAPVSLLSVLQSLPGEEDLSARFSELRYVGRDRLRPILDEQARLALVTAYVPDAGASALREPLDDLEGRLRAIEGRYAGFQIDLTGFAVLATYRTGPMIMNMLTGVTLELVIIVVIISLALRSAKLGLLSLPSNVFPLLATAAGLVILRMPLQYATVLSFNICLGIAVDDTVHFLTRYQREVEAGDDALAAIRHSFRAVCPVMVTQTILMLTGFGAGLLCSIPTIRAFSICSCLALILALVSEALILPALLVCVTRLTGGHRPAPQATPLTAAMPDGVSV